MSLLASISQSHSQGVPCNDKLPVKRARERERERKDEIDITIH